MIRIDSRSLYTVFSSFQNGMFVGNVLNSVWISCIIIILSAYSVVTFAGGVCSVLRLLNRFLSFCKIVYFVTLKIELEMRRDVTKVQRDSFVVWNLFIFHCGV